MDYHPTFSFTLAFTRFPLYSLPGTLLGGSGVCHAHLIRADHLDAAEASQRDTSRDREVRVSHAIMDFKLALIPPHPTSTFNLPPHTIPFVLAIDQACEEGEGKRERSASSS